MARSSGRLAMCVIEVESLLPQPAAVRVEQVVARAGTLRVRALTRTRDDVSGACPGCGQESDWVHSGYVRYVQDEAFGGRFVVIELSVRRLYCENPDCVKTPFVERVEGLTERYPRRTPALRRVVEAVAVAPAGSAGARLPRPALRVEPGECAEPPDAHRTSRPGRAEGGRSRRVRSAQGTQVHDLLDAGVGLPECSRRLNPALNTVGRCARHGEPDWLVRAPRYRPVLVDPYREHPRRRRAEDPSVPVTHLPAEIEEQGCTGSATFRCATSTGAASRPSTPHCRHAVPPACWSAAPRTCARTNRCRATNSSPPAPR